MRVVKSMVITNRAKLLTAIEKPEIITGINLDRNGVLNISTCNWWAYWKPILSRKDSTLTCALESLHAVWTEYIQSRFNTSFHRKYCYLYYALMHLAYDMLKNCTGADRLKIITKIAAFENCSIKLDCKAIVGCAACTTTVRNPNYLLGKIKNPTIPDDPQLLPLISIFDTAPELYYYYRQHKLALDSHASLLLYPAVNHYNRASSFTIINKMEPLISAGMDPWAGKRAATYAKEILPLIVKSLQGADKKHNMIEFVDLGSGSGSLLAYLCDILAEALHSKGFKCIFRIWLIDIAPVLPEKEFAKLKRRGLLDSVTCMAADYKEWLVQKSPLPHKSGPRICIISRFFNNFSDFVIRNVDNAMFGTDPSLSTQLNNMTQRDPFVCLAPSGAGPKNLSASSKKIAFKDGRSFYQFSHSNYYKCLCYLQNNKNIAPDTAPNIVFLPLRKFQTDSLILPNGNSILERLLGLCDAIALQDADLTPELLHLHVENCCRTPVNVSDRTSDARLHGHYFYLITNKRPKSAHGDHQCH